MKLYLVSLGAGILVGIIYALMQVRSPAPPVVALIGLLGMLIGEQVVPPIKRMLAGEPVTAAWFHSECVPKITGAPPSTLTAANKAEAANPNGASADPMPYRRLVSPRVAALGLGLGLCVAGGPAAAQSSVTIYGRLNTAIEYSRASTATDGTALGSVVRQTNYRSVFGLRGEEGLGGSLTGAVADREQPVARYRPGPDRQPQLARRPPGRLRPAVHGALADALYRVDGGLRPVLPDHRRLHGADRGNGSTSSSDNVQDTSSFDRRQKNIVQYRSPQFGGVSVWLGWGCRRRRPPWRAIRRCTRRRRSTSAAR